jgi:ADP-ribose pyrophosphatase YjhB (NUDIX family)
MSGAQRTRVAAYALVRDGEGRILLCRIAPSVVAGEVWTLPGGGLEFGEQPDAAVLRELAEEAGYQGEIVALADVYSRTFPDSDEGGRLQAIRIVYRVQIMGGELRDEVDGTTDTCAWFTLENARSLRLGDLAKRALAIAAADSAANGAADSAPAQNPSPGSARDGA